MINDSIKTFLVVWAGVILAILIGFTVGNYEGKYEQKQADVYAICNESRISATINETQCGDLQTSTNTEFLCQSNNTNVTTHCWVEVK